MNDTQINDDNQLRDLVEIMVRAWFKEPVPQVEDALVRFVRIRERLARADELESTFIGRKHVPIDLITQQISNLRNFE